MSVESSAQPLSDRARLKSRKNLVALAVLRAGTKRVLTERKALLIFIKITNNYSQEAKYEDLGLAPFRWNSPPRRC